MRRNQLEQLEEAATTILRGSLREVDGRLFAVPSGALYPAAWGWDTPQIAAGLYAKEPDQALRLMEDFLSYQWENGMVPQVVFPTVQPGERFDKDAYFPGPHVWYMSDDTIRDYDAAPAESFTRHPAYAETGGKTTAIPQYPIWALNLKQMHDEAPIPQERLGELVEKLDGFHRYFYAECDPDHLGMVAELHPWLGCDNAPPYVKAMKRLAATASAEELAAVNAQRVDVKRVVEAGGDPDHRPTDGDYAAFLKIAHGIALATEKRERGEAVTTDDLPFVVYSPMLNGMLLRAEEDLASLAEAAGKPELADAARNRAAGLRTNLMRHLWDEAEQGFAYLDAKSGEKAQTGFIGALIPLLDPELPEPARQALENRLETDFMPGYAAPLPSTARHDRDYEPCYWRGPMWVNMTELLRPYVREPEKLRDATLDRMEKEGFREYFNAETGAGMGADNFSWSAAYGARMAREALQEQTRFQSRLEAEQRQAGTAHQR